MILAVSEVLGPVYTLWQELLWKGIHQLESKAKQKLLYWPSPEMSDMHAAHSRWQQTCRSTIRMIQTDKHDHRTRQKLAHSTSWWYIFSLTAVLMMLMMEKQLLFIRRRRSTITVITTITLSAVGPDAVQSIHIFIIYVSENHCDSMYLLQPVLPSRLSPWIWKYRTLYAVLISLIKSFSNVIFYCYFI